MILSGNVASGVTPPMILSGNVASGVTPMILLVNVEASGVRVLRSLQSEGGTPMNEAPFMPNL